MSHSDEDIRDLLSQLGAACTALAIAVLATGRKVLAHVDDDEPAPHSIDEARAATVGD